METNLNIEEKDLKFIRDYLKEKDDPVPIEEISLNLAFYKTEKNRAQKVKIYSPGCEYKEGDLIYKEYPGKLPVGTKKHLELESGVVLKVVEVRTRFKDEIKLAYEGTSDYKKYIDYLKRQKIELLLPHKQSKPCLKTEYLNDDDDPRKKYAPLLKKDFNTMNKKLATALSRSSDIAFTGDKILLKKRLKPVENEVFDKIREFLKENAKADSTEFFVENFLKIPPADKSFESYCFSLNYRMKTDFKIDFQQVNFKGWGKWNLISQIYYKKRDSILSEKNPLKDKVHIENKKGLSHLRKKFIEEIFDNDSNRYFISQREIAAGGLRLRDPGTFTSEYEEVKLIDEGTRKEYIVYFYSEANLLLGLEELYSSYKIIQGAIFTISSFDDNNIFFNLRTTKKGTISERVDYDNENRTFISHEEKLASQVFVNKAMYLEHEEFLDIASNIDYYRKSDSLNELIYKVFMNFGIKERNSELHILHLYHILDIIYPIRFETVADVLIGNNEFIASEKISGVYYLDLNQDERSKLGVSASQSQELPKTPTVKKESQKDEIKRLREERKRKREEEMLRKEQLEQERISTASRLEKKPLPSHPRREEKISSPQEPVFEKQRKKSSVQKKSSKSEYKEKESKPVKKTIPKPQDEQLDIEDIKSEIELLKLKEEVEKKRKDTEKKKKEKEVAFKDDGKGIGGIFASKLDEIVKTESDKEKNKKKK